MTGIEWTQRVWNATTGCDRVSPGCDHCYALTMAKRLKGMGQAKYQRDGDPKTSGPGFGLTTHDSVVTEPFKWRTPQRVFVNSMSDLLHADVPDDFIARVFAVMAATPHHTYQLLTKRHARLRSLVGSLAFRAAVARAVWALDGQGFQKPVHPIWPLPNVWIGVSVESQKWADIRIPALLETPAAVHWISAEPLLGPIDLGNLICCDDCMGSGEVGDDDLLCVTCGGTGSLLDWCVVGGESGPGARPLDEQWIRSLVKQCRLSVPIFVKQLGSVWGRANGADPKGGKPEFWPEDLRVREYPQPAAVTS